MKPPKSRQEDHAGVYNDYSTLRVPRAPSVCAPASLDSPFASRAPRLRIVCARTVKCDHVGQWGTYGTYNTTTLPLLLLKSTVHDDDCTINAVLRWLTTDGGRRPSVCACCARPRSGFRQRAPSRAEPSRAGAGHSRTYSIVYPTLTASDAARRILDARRPRLPRPLHPPRRAWASACLWDKGWGGVGSFV